MKECSMCHFIKDDSDFNKEKKHRDGLRYECKSCEKEYAKEYRERNRARIQKLAKDYYHKHKDYYKQC